MNKKIYIAGHTGLVGSAVKNEFEEQGYKNLIYKTHQELDLTNYQDVEKFFQEEKPEWVILAAAKVGGIYANQSYPVEFILENIKIQNNIIENSYKYNVKKILFLGSSCIYPKNTPQPMKEEYLLTNKLEKTNEGYALAKILGIKLCNAYNKQYNTDFISIMPCNLYGINDNYHPENSHVIPALIRKFHNAKLKNLKQVEVWGSGKPRREFLNSIDLAKAILFLMENKSAKEIGEFINVGSGYDMTIAKIAEVIKKIVGFEGEIIYNTSLPDGTMEKLLDISKISSYGWKAQIDFEEGLKETYQDFLNKIDK